jgi:predicted membrane metal-binding protein
MSTPIALYNKKSAQVFKALITGEKRHLSKSFKRKIKTLNLIHLFTPSGLHFSSILLFLLPISLYSKKGFKIVSVFLCFTPFFFTGLYSMKRIALLRLVFMIKSKFKYLRDLDSFQVLLLVFSVDFIFGTYSHSPMSFACSLLFLGAIFSSEKYSTLEITSKFILAQVLMAIIFKTFWNPVGSLLGLLITSLFSLIFPFFLADMAIISLFQYSFFSSLMDSFIFIIDKAYQLSINFDVLWPNLFLVLAIYLCMFKNKIKYMALPLFLLFSNPTVNLPPSGLKGFQPKAKHYPHWVKEAVKVSKIPRGYKTYLSNGFQCYHHLKRWGYTSKCKRKKLPKGYWK